MEPYVPSGFGACDTRPRFEKPHGFRYEWDRTLSGLADA
jgi:hypothetical protein